MLALVNQDEKIIQSIKYSEAWRNRVLNGVDSFEFKTYDLLSNGDRVCFYDHEGKWREYLIASIEALHDEKGIEYTVSGDGSYHELIGYAVEKLELKNVTPSYALAVVLENTRFTVGYVESANNVNIEMENTNKLAVLYEIINQTGLELDVSIGVNSTKTAVTERTINLVQHIGSTIAKRFSYDINIASVKKSIDFSQLATKIIAFGKVEERKRDKLPRYDENGYPIRPEYEYPGEEKEKEPEERKRINLKSVTGGSGFITDEAARSKWGYGRNRPHIEKIVIFNDVDDVNELKIRAIEELQKCKEPIITYEINVEDLSKLPEFKHFAVGLGDNVIVRDFELGIAVETRVVEIKDNPFEQTVDTEITLGNSLLDISDDISRMDNIRTAVNDQLSEFNKDVYYLENGIKSSFIDSVVDKFNNELNQTGGWVYAEEGEGILILNAPKDKNPTQAIKIGGGVIGLASEKNPDGSFKYRTFGDGTGVIADEIKTGVLRGGRVYWDLNNGTFIIGNSLTDYHMLWDGKTLKFRNVDLDLKNNYEFKQIKTDIDKSIAGVNSDLKTYVDDNDKLIDSKIDSVSQSLTVAEGKLNSSISAVRTETYKDINGVKTDLANNYDTKSQVDTKIKNADSSVRTYISKNYSSITQTDKKIQSQVGSVKTEINNNLSENYYTKSQTDSNIKNADSSIRSYVEKNYSTITQTDSKIASKVSSTKKEIMTDVNSSIGSVKSNLANNYDTKSQVDAKIKNADTSVRTYISKNYSTTTQTDSKIASKVASEIKAVNERIDSKDSSLRTYVSNNYSTKTQTSSLIESKVSSIKSDISGINIKLSDAESKISQTASEIATKVSKNGIISAINQSSESVKIQASKIALKGSVWINGDISIGQVDSDKKPQYMIFDEHGITWQSDNFLYYDRADDLLNIKSIDGMGITITNNKLDAQTYINPELVKTNYIRTKYDIETGKLLSGTVLANHIKSKDGTTIEVWSNIGFNKDAAFGDTTFYGDIKVKDSKIWLGDWNISKDSTDYLLLKNSTNTVIEMRPSRAVMDVKFDTVWFKDIYGGDCVFNKNVIQHWEIYEDTYGDLCFKNIKTGAYYYMNDATEYKAL